MDQPTRTERCAVKAASPCQDDTALSGTSVASSSLAAHASYFGIGVLFAIGLGVSGMTLPSKVVGFLDFTGAWDPSLGLVMAGAIAIHLVGYRWIIQRPSPLLAQRFCIPTRRDISPRLVFGAALFGLGWGLGGLCPGPSLVGVGALSLHAVVFVIAMGVGIQGFHMADNAMSKRA